MNESCLTDLVKHLSESPKGSARVWNESEKFYIKLTRADAGLRAEAGEAISLAVSDQD